MEKISLFLKNKSIAAYAALLAWHALAATTTNKPARQFMVRNRSDINCTGILL
jgi:hypothetical protein